MNIGIITQPLLNNYGGVMQNLALQEILRKLGHNPITIDYIPPRKSLLRYMFSKLKMMIFCLLGRKRSCLSRDFFCRKPQFESFVENWINKTPIVHKYKVCRDLKNIDCFIVGSDQVWRPLYNSQVIYDLFLRFCVEKKDVKRLAYAASFGVDTWEFSPKQTKVCSFLAKKIDAISVREKSGVDLCKRYLNVDASWVLDPTLLLDKNEYCRFCAEVPIEKDILAVYVLNMDESTRFLCEEIAKKKKLTMKVLGSDANASLTIPEWLALFRDASYVVTDSFHGTVFSIIFEKEFKCIYNQKRGAARFHSLLNVYNSGKLKEMRNYSIAWLKDALNN